MRIALKPLAEQVIVITGASSGIGLVTAKAAARKGASVMLVARNEASLKDAVRQIEDEAGVADYAVADVGIASDVEAAAEKTLARYGRIDSWVNNAGVAIYAKLVDTPDGEHDRLFRTNYFGAVHGCLTAVKHLRERGGALITVGSIASDLPSPILGAYSASKHATAAFIDALRMELRADDVPISLTLVKPSGIDTPIGQHAANHLDGEALIPAPVYDPELVAKAILDACVYRRRDVTVGGFGRLQVLLGTHFPAMLDRMSGLLIEMMSDPKKPKTSADSLFEAGADGEERSALQSGRRFSLYTAAGRHPVPVAAAGLALALVAGGFLFRRRPYQAAVDDDNR